MLSGYDSTGPKIGWRLHENYQHAWIEYLYLASCLLHRSYEEIHRSRVAKVFPDLKNNPVTYPHQNQTVANEHTSTRS